MSKYNANTITIDGIKFDSKMEGQYYEYLKEKKCKGDIINFELQPEFILQQPFMKYGIKYKAIRYIADFMVYNNDGSITIIDVKGFETADFKLKKKLFDYNYKDLVLKCVTRNLKHSKDGWIEIAELKKIKAKNNKIKKLITQDLSCVNTQYMV